MIVDASILPGFRPVPEDLGWVFDGKRRHMTGLAGDRGEMCVDALIFMLLVDMALFTGDLFLGIDRVVVRDHAPLDLVVIRPMAVGPLHVQLASLVRVVVLRAEVEALILVAVLDAVPAAAV